MEPQSQTDNWLVSEPQQEAVPEPGSEDVFEQVTGKVSGVYGSGAYGAAYDLNGDGVREILLKGGSYADNCLVMLYSSGSHTVYNHAVFELTKYQDVFYSPRHHAFATFYRLSGFEDYDFEQMKENGIEKIFNAGWMDDKSTAVYVREYYYMDWQGEKVIASCQWSDEAARQQAEAAYAQYVGGLEPIEFVSIVSDTFVNALGDLLHGSMTSRKRSAWAVRILRVIAGGGRRAGKSAMKCKTAFHSRPLGVEINFSLHPAMKSPQSFMRRLIRAGFCGMMLSNRKSLRPDGGAGNRKGVGRMPAAEKQYKDRLFSFIFGNAEHRDWTLSLYNAVNGSAYTDADQIEITTIRQVLYLGMHNDLSFMISGEINMYEQQSTYNPNMPLRMLQYAGSMYEKEITRRKKNKYGRTLVTLAVPRLVTFYNGRDDEPDEQILRLSDAFPEDRRGDSDIEVRVRMININRGHNASLLESCRPLDEYAWVVDRIRSLEETVGLEAAIDQAIREMPDSCEIKGFLEENKAEVKDMLLTEYDEAKQMELFREEGREEGLKEGQEIGIRKGEEKGRAEGILSVLTALVRDGMLSLKEGAARSGLSLEAFRKELG